MRTRNKKTIHDRLAMAKETRRSMEGIRHAHMALPAAAADGRQDTRRRASRVLFGVLTSSVT